MKNGKNICLGLIPAAAIFAFLGLMAVIFELSSLFDTSLFHTSHWSQVPPPELYVTTQPKEAEVAGIYHLVQQIFWGLVFSESAVGIEPLALRSNGNPYNLMFTYSDPDEGKIMTFGKGK